MITDEAVMDVLATVPDPEMPISIVDLGLIERVRIESGADGARVAVVVLPTFVGCPALDMIRADIEAKLGAVEGVARVEVTFVHDPPWSVDRITEEGRRALRDHGVTVPDRGDRPATGGDVELRASALSCPFCGSSDVTVDSPFGPTRCRMIMYCSSCRNPFERMRKLEG